MNEDLGPFSTGPAIGMRSRGVSLSEVFAQTTEGMFALIVDPATVEERDVREVRAHAGSLERLLANWLNECLYVHDVEGFIPRRVEVSPVEAVPRPGGEPFRVHGLLHGEDIDPGRHVTKLAIKSAPADATAVVIDGGVAEARALFEV